MIKGFPGVIALEELSGFQPSLRLEDGSLWSLKHRVLITYTQVETRELFLLFYTPLMFLSMHMTSEYLWADLLGHSSMCHHLVY